MHTLKTRTKFIFFVACFTVLYSANLMATVAGNINFVSKTGKIQIISKNKKEIKTPKSENILVDYDDLIRTDARARIELSMLDGKYKIDIYPNTVYRITRPKRKKNVAVLFLGKVLFSINKLAKSLLGESFSVRGKFSTMGVKGTVFIAEETPESSVLTVLEGAVTFANNRIPDKEITVSTLQRSVITQNDKPSAPVVISKGDAETLTKPNTQSKESKQATEDKKNEETAEDKEAEKKSEMIEEVNDVIEQITLEQEQNADIENSKADIKIILDF